MLGLPCFGKMISKLDYMFINEKVICSLLDRFLFCCSEHIHEDAHASATFYSTTPGQ